MTAQALHKEIRACRICEEHLPMGCKPIITFNSQSKILVVGQAPGIRVHKSGIPWNDPSGENLRTWLNVTKEDFYNKDIFGIVPMGFCYPGTGKNGDLPPRKECATQWHESILALMPNLKLTLLIGNYAQKYYLGKDYYKNLTETTRRFEEYLPTYFPLPHPSPRNNIWQKKNPWFKEVALPILTQTVQSVIVSP